MASEQIFARFDLADSANSIAIIVPNYNHGRYLAESLSSIIGQKHQPDEVLVIDDGSRDNSVEIISEFLKDRPTWRMIRHEENSGVVKRLNEGISAVRSSWISMLGADDLLDPQYLELVSQMAIKYPSAGLLCGCVEIFGPGIRPRLRPPILPRDAASYVSPDQFRELLKIGDNYFIGTATTYQRKAILEVGGLEEQLGPICDGYLARQIAARHGFGFIPKVLGYWRIHGQNYSVSTAKDPKAFVTKLQAVRAAIDREPAGTFPPGYAHALVRRLRFGGARLVAMDRKIPPAKRAAVVAELVNADKFERSALYVLSAAGRIGSILTLAWLTIRLRPLSLVALIQQYFLRRSIRQAPKTP